ncbi:MAG: alpha/beta fold hydrolase [Intrasporangium sp.]|uniref:alpha/beta hydrolase n=1 Tax=Intrasporangium sp. TaxID=1925024 RepID=UPI00264768A9|nr:alpha/beta fold hydrolase [Intrasporangium sp.]MDN5796678.1 alpha/beta fold hydrolase [Intrasporangium sp.]
MRAHEPDESGYALNDGVRVYYEVHGTGSPTLLLLPTWAIVHSRMWKLQVPYLARHYRVVTFDPRGNGRTDRPRSAAGYGTVAMVGDALAVLDATGTERAVLVAHCLGTAWATYLTTQHPERVLGLVALASLVPGHPGSLPERSVVDFETVPQNDDGWNRETRHYWQRDWPGYIRFFTEQMTPEPHSTKPRDDLLGWGCETDADTILHDVDARCPVLESGPDERDALCRALNVPVLAVCGDRDKIVDPGKSVRFAELTGGDLLMLEGAGHAMHVRHPVVVNEAIRHFVDRVVPPGPRATPWVFARERRHRALWISSPIGLGHVLRDLAIARAVREQVPDLVIEWLAQPPVAGVLEQAGEIVHPASAELVSESAHWESEASGHELHAFEAFRRLDEVFCANYLLFDEVVRQTPYDLWVGDESWEVDHFLHEHPERKLAPYVFTTDVVGFLPVDPERDSREIELTADYNAEMIEHRERFPRVRDRSIFIGGWDELPDASLGPGLPRVREWASQWFESVPYVVPFDPRDYRDPMALRRRLGYREDVPLLAGAVGGTAVGRALLELMVEAFGRLRKELSGAEMVLVTGPRIDPADLPDLEGLTKYGYLQESFAHLAAADAAVVQGGLSTTMELVAARRPFVYFPLARHWEQEHFVTHRLRHYRAGRPMDFASTTPRLLADALIDQLSRTPRYRAVPRDGARAAADRIVPLLTGHAHV